MLLLSEKQRNQQIKRRYYVIKTGKDSLAAGAAFTKEKLKRNALLRNKDRQRQSCCRCYFYKRETNKSGILQELFKVVSRTLRE